MIQNDATRRHPPIEVEQGASRGQIIVMFAFFVTVMFGLLGLAVDLGMAFAERRTMQNAADLGAIAGARAIVRYTTANPASAFADVQTIVSGNSMANAPTIDSCVYVNDSNANVGDCTSTVPASATGVRVTVSETHPTYFIRVIPGAPNSATTSATATAHVRLATNVGSDGPFIVCGMGTELASGGSVSILSNNSAVNPSAIGQTFEIHGPQIARCGLSNSSFKGLADQASNSGKALGEYWTADNGVKAGPTRVRVSGIEGCARNAADPYTCVLLLPVATDNPAPVSSNPRKFYVVKILAFRVASCGSNCHKGTLLDDYIVSGPNTGGWTRDSGGVAVVKLTS
ncbi:MAG: hypothetical protein QOF33_1692 [Thermomicrobiales bacterium]|jgi:Flp pilus assembly protein TadG|nr:hypothetical protein [Thermomicrobiales bacterium]